MLLRPRGGIPRVPAAYHRRGETMTPRTIGTALLFSTVALTLPATADMTSPVGKWRTFHPDSGAPQSIVEIAVKNGTFEGTIVELLAGSTETHCAKCEGARKNQPLVGMTILWDLKAENGGWGGGTILRPATGGTANASIKLTAGGQKIDVKGSRGVASRTQTWERIGQ
jgi:uncharacterized protein (DUF2147 family)